MKTVLMWEAFQGLRGAWQLAIRLVWGQRLRSATTLPPTLPQAWWGLQEGRGQGRQWAGGVLLAGGARADPPGQPRREADTQNLSPQAGKGQRGYLPVYGGETEAHGGQAGQVTRM